MRLLLKAFKTEIAPTEGQKTKIIRSIGVARFLYNQYIAYNLRLYKMYQRGILDEKQKRFVTANDFDKYVNHKLKKELPWIAQCGSKARKKALVNAEQAFRRFFSGTSGYHTVTYGVGIDLGVKDLAIVSDGKAFKNINKGSKVKRLEKRLRREQRRLSRKYEFRKKKGGITATASANIDKQKLKVQKIHHHITTIREDYENKTVHKIVKQKPRFITVEDLNVKGMMKNRHLAKAIAAQRFNHLLAKLKRKAEIIGIELREVDRFYPSSKTCHTCGHIHKGLKLKDRMYACPKCGYTADRDYNASLNLRDAKEYRVS